MNTPPRYQIIEQFRISVRKKTYIVSRLYGQRWHCNCPDCNLGYCDRNCEHVMMAMADGIPIEPVGTEIAKAVWKTEGRKVALRLEKVLPWKTPPKEIQKVYAAKLKEEKVPPAPAPRPKLGNAYR